MKTYGVVGQFGWFAFGTWVGAALCILLQMIHTLEINSWLDGETGMALLLAGYVLIAVLLATPHAVWLWLRTRRRRQPCEVPWFVSLILGLAYLPLLSGIVPLLIVLTGQGQGTVIGTSICACVFGLPIAFAEGSLLIAWRCRARQLRQDSLVRHGSDFTMPTSATCRVPFGHRPSTDE